MSEYKYPPPLPYPWWERVPTTDTHKLACNRVFRKTSYDGVIYTFMACEKVCHK